MLQHAPPAVAVKHICRLLFRSHLRLSCSPITVSNWLSIGRTPGWHSKPTFSGPTITLQSKSTSSSNRSAATGLPLVPTATTKCHITNSTAGRPHRVATLAARPRSLANTHHHLAPRCPRAGSKTTTPRASDGITSKRQQEGANGIPLTHHHAHQPSSLMASHPTHTNISPVDTSNTGEPGQIPSLPLPRPTGTASS